MESEPQEEAGLLARVLAAVVGVVGRRPWLVLAGVLLSCVGSGYYTYSNLTYLTHRNDLISSNKEYLKRWRQYVDEFGDDDDMVVVVRGADRKQMESVLDDLAAEIEKRPESFDRLFYKVDLTSLHSRALLFLPTEQIRDVQSHIQGMSLLLEPPVLGTLDPLFGWKSLGVQQLLREGERKLELWKPNEPNREAEEFFKQLTAICNGASDYLESPDKYRNPWQSILPSPTGRGAGGGGSQQDHLARPQYFFSGDGTLAMLMVSPVKDRDSENFTGAQKSINALKTLIDEVKARHGNIDIGITGLPVLENDEMIASQNDSNFASWLALAGVALLYLVVYRGFRYPFMTVAALIVGTIWALGWLTLTVGHLNILSSAFAVMLIGMGDYGVLWVTCFGQERQAGHDIAEANRRTALHVGPSIVTAAVATGFSFFAAMLADLKAVSELGWIAGCGVLLCALSCFLVVPALLAIFDFRVHAKKADDEMILSMKEHQEARREWLPWLLQRPRWVLAGSVMLTLILAGFALNIDYDHNLLHMQAQDMESVKWEKELIAHTSDSSWYAVSWTTTPEEALALKEKYEQLPEVSSVITLASLIPPDQDRKVEMLRDIQQRLRKLPKRGQVIEHAKPNIEEINRTCGRISQLCSQLQSERSNAALAELSASVARLQNTLIWSDRTALTRAFSSGTVIGGVAQPMQGIDSIWDKATTRLKEFDEKLTQSLADSLHQLNDVSMPSRIGMTDIPECLRERYIGKNGKWLLRVFSKGCLWDFAPLDKFVSAVRTVDPEATGKPFTTLEGLKAMRNGFLWAAVYALIAMVIVLLLDFGKIKHMLIALLPLAMGMIATLGIMALLGYALNPANMIAFPLILGVGADNGVHVLHDYRNRDKRRRYRLSHVTGFGIMVAALTTILGFGTLMIAQHRGMASLGMILTVGVSCCMLTALVFLPALLNVMGRVKKPATEEVVLPMSETGRKAA